MREWLRNIFDWARKDDVASLRCSFDAVAGALLKHFEAKETLDSRALVRHALGSIDSSDLEPSPNRESEVNQVGPISDILKAIAERLIRRQERFVSAEAADWGQALVGRGTINGIELFKDEIEELRNEWERSRRKDAE